MTELTLPGFPPPAPVTPDDRARLAARCVGCEGPFTPPEWEDRHSSDDGEDLHAECCLAPGCRPCM